MSKLIGFQLHLNGWVAVLIGSLIALDPVSVLSSYGLQPELSAGLLSELRAPGGLLLVCGLLILSCALQPSKAKYGLMLSVIVYGGYGSVRLLAILLDGLPAVEIQLAAAIELVLCASAVVTLAKIKRRNQLALGS